MPVAIIWEMMISGCDDGCKWQGSLQIFEALAIRLMFYLLSFGEEYCEGGKIYSGYTSIKMVQPNTPTIAHHC